MVVSAVTITLVVDTSIIKISDLSSDYQLSFSNLKITAFIIISAVYIIAQYVILNFVKTKNTQIRDKDHMLQVVHKVVTVLQYLLTAILVGVILQMIILSYYNVAILAVATAISYMLAISMMALLALRFFRWFKSNRNSVVLFYGLSAASLLINTVFTTIFVIDILMNRPVVQYSYIDSNPPYIVPGSPIDSIYNVYVTSAVMAFLLTWVATALLLRHYSQKLGKVKYWVIVTIPLIYFLSQFFALFINYMVSPLLTSKPIFFSILFTLIFTYSKPAGGILFGVAFWTTARSIHRDSIVRDYMTISAYGLMLMFVSNQAIVLVDAPYPPFGLATVSFIGLSSYLILVGIYSSAISVAQDSKLRQSIRNIAIKETKLLDSIGTAHMEQEIQKTVIRITKRNQDRMLEETGIQSSLSEDEMKAYLDTVISEVQKDRNRK